MITKAQPIMNLLQNNCLLNCSYYRNLVITFERMFFDLQQGSNIYNKKYSVVSYQSSFSTIKKCQASHFSLSNVRPNSNVSEKYRHLVYSTPVLKHKKTWYYLPNFGRTC